MAVVNTDFSACPADGLDDCDWFFNGDAAKVLPKIFKSFPDLGEIEVSPDV